MSTANYRTMDNFSLFVREDQDEAKRCHSKGDKSLFDYL